MAYEAAARFLAAALPWPAAGSEPPEFWINVHTTNKKPGGFTGVYGTACRTVDEAVRQVAYYSSRGQDVWVCMSGQSEARADEKFSWRMKAVRKSDNAVAHKSIYIDIDVKQGGFPDLQSAVQAFGAWRAKVGLPAPSMAVASGSGLHVHWCFADPIDTQRWRLLANKLVAAMQQHGLAPIDYGVTRDAARLLRVPDTNNYKTDPPLPVYLLAEGTVYDVAYIEDALKAYQVTPQVNSAGGARTSSVGIAWPVGMPPPPKGVAFVPLAAGAGKILPRLEQVAKVCPSIANSLRTGGVADEQPLWHAMAKVACFTEGGLDDFLDMSQDHPAYDEDEAVAFFDRVKREQEQRDFGWPTCQTIQLAKGVGCAGCPHLAAGKTPFHFIEVDAPKVEHPPTPLDPGNPPSYDDPDRSIDEAFRQNPPKGFGFDKTGGLVFLMQTDDGEDDSVVVCPYFIARMWFQTEPYKLTLIMQTDQRGLRQIVLRSEDMANADRLATGLYRQGVVIKRGVVGKFGDFMTSWIEQMREKRIATMQSERFGWATANGKTHSFVYGKTRYNHEGSSPIMAQDGILGTMYTPTGALEPWMRASRLICDQKRPALNAILASAFAAPLINFTGENGFMLSAFSPESGMQKSTAMRVAQAVWGDPIKGMNSLNDTANSINKKLGALRHLPMYYDEIKMEEGNRRNLDMLFELSQGKTKTRLDRQSDLQEIETWATLLQCASNSSMVGFITNQSKTTTAGAHRVFEYQVTRPHGNYGLVSLGDAGKALQALNDNFGRAGEVYAAWLGKNIDMVTDRVSAAKDTITKQVNGKSEERFWITAIAVLMLGAKFANINQLTMINEAELLQFLLQSFETLRRKVGGANVDLGQSVTVLERLAQYINQRKRMTMITDYIPSNTGRPRDCMVINTTEVMNAMAFNVRVANIDQAIRFSKADFMSWCHREGIAAGLVLDAMIKQLGAKEVRVSVTAGVKGYRSATERLIELTNHNGQLSSFYDFGDP